MRKLEEILPIIGAYRYDDADLLQALTIDEMKLFIDHYAHNTIVRYYIISFKKEVMRIELVEVRDTKIDDICG